MSFILFVVFVGLKYFGGKNTVLFRPSPRRDPLGIYTALHWEAAITNKVSAGRSYISISIKDL